MGKKRKKPLRNRSVGVVEELTTIVGAATIVRKPNILFYANVAPSSVVREDIEKEPADQKQ